VIITWIFNITNVFPPEKNLLNKPLLEERLTPGWFSVAVALAAGVAGALASIKQNRESLIGAVTALALVPAASAAGIAFLSKDPYKGFGELMLLSINVITIILAGAVILCFDDKASRR